MTAAAMPLKDAVRQQAIEWFVRLHAGDAGPDDHAACVAWRRADPAHEQAWTRLDAIRGCMTDVPATIAAPTLRAAAQDRRTALKMIALFAVGGAGIWGVAREQPWAPYLADHRTAVGELRQLTLADGSTLILNTGSAVDVRFDATARLLHVRAGEILVETAHAPAEHRPLIVQTRHGRVRALGTRFSVRDDGDSSVVSVMAHAVAVLPERADVELRLDAGQQLRFDGRRVHAPTPLAAGPDTWTQGQLIVNDRPLSEVIAELSRYRPGRIRCAPAVAGIRVSGVFPLTDVDRALVMLASRFPISVSSTTRYWITIDTAS